VSKVEALLRALGAEVSELDSRRLKIVMPGGQETWIRLGCGIESPDLDTEAEDASPRGDQSHRLELHLDHHRTDVLQREGDQAGQRAPIDSDDLAQIVAAMAAATRSQTSTASTALGLATSA